MAWARHGWLRGALALWASFLFAPGALAEADAHEQGGPEQNTAPQAGPEQSGWLHWQGPIECQNTREVERQLESLLGYAPERAQLPATRVEVGWGSARGWSLLIRVSLPQGERRREVVVRTCADGFDVVALTLALILDPELGGDTELDAEAPANPDVSQPLAQPTEAPTASSVPLLAAPAPPPESQLAATEEAPPALALLADGRPKLLLVGSGRADLGSLPATLFGGGLTVSLSAWHWRIDAGAAYLGRSTQTLPLAVNEVSYSNALGLVRGCREFNPRGGGRFDVCLGAQLGSLAVSELAGERRNGRGVWAAGTLGAELGLELSEAWGAFSGVELAFPLARHELGLASGAVVYEVPAVSVQLTLGASFRLTESASP